MGLLKQTQNQYYSGEKSFTGDAATTIFTVSTNADQFPSTFDVILTTPNFGAPVTNAIVYIDGVLFAQSTITDPVVIIQLLMVGIYCLPPLQQTVL